MLNSKTRKFYQGMLAATLTASVIAPAVVTEAAPAKQTVKLKAAFVENGDLDAALDKTYQGNKIYWYKSTVDMDKLGTYQTVKGYIKWKNQHFEKKVRVINYPKAIIAPKGELTFKHGEKLTGQLNTLQIQFVDRVLRQPVKWTNLSTDKIGKFTATASYTHKGRTVTLDVPYEVKGYELSFMHTNDTHASLDFAANRAAAVKELRAQNPNRLLVDAGDVFSGSLYFNEFKGQVDLKLMNYMKYDMMVPGNHEFDLGTETGHKEFSQFVRYANFPFVSSNVDYSNDQYMKSLFRDEIATKPFNGRLYEGIIQEVDGKKVGFFGLTTEDTANIASPGPIQFQNYIEEAKKAVKAFEDMGVDQIVAVSHLGYDDNPAIDNDLELAKHVDGIDVIIGGHSHTRLDAPVLITEGDNPTVIVQAYQYGDFLGTLDLVFDKDGKVVSQAGKLIDVKTYAPDPGAARLLAPFAAEIDGIKNAEIGASATAAFENLRDSGDVTKPSVRKNETALGNLITDGMLDRAKQVDPQVVAAIQNAGGIRAAINEGPITTGEVLTTLPFGNTLAVMTLQGSELLAALERSVSVYPIESGGFLHMSGMKLEFDSSKPANSRVVKAQVLQGETYVDIDPSATYKIATNFFAAKGGDNYLEFKKAYEEGRVNDLGLIDWEIMRDYLVKQGEVTPTVEGRVVDVKE
ncbi:bifunctional metallophosphatase/5'-nucleotidase [Exiguobacterium aurantiacum]|uniref:Trifunctional nucleotide phosphoesterase protein YfkN n=1 Tax=Exiguobacterium aurantiacum TaxID=33987 RepID=A0A377FRA0_9BACL|nr:5'-nucleotidase C-terminal domain-containing protein [Exiguobacterium aurantiacum]STO07361.1 Trifunctional nucleotide phosphoesterase protein YfkN precursor [Exiguobacterium aurantiacum]